MASKAQEAGRKRRLEQEKKARRGTPEHKRKMLIIWGVSVLAVAAGAYAFARNAPEPRDCPGHWHSTFAVFVPGENGQPEQIDFAGPRSKINPSFAYYQLQHDPKMTVAIHMHQSGAEQGSEAVGPYQLHYETNGRCVGVQDSMETVDIQLESDTLGVSGEHAQAGQTGFWENAGNQTVRFWHKPQNGAWQERPVSEMLDHQPGDGESFLIAYGDYGPQQVEAMQATIPPAMSGVA